MQAQCRVQGYSLRDHRMRLIPDVRCAGARGYSLRDNYRSTPQVLAAALAVLPTPAPLQPLRGAGVPVQVGPTPPGPPELGWFSS